MLGTKHLPMPKSKKYTRRLAIDVPDPLKTLLQEQAGKIGISTNAYLNPVLAALGRGEIIVTYRMGTIKLELKNERDPRTVPQGIHQSPS